MFNRRKKSSNQNIGCGFLLATGVTILGLFIVNNLVVRMIFSTGLQETDGRIFQATQFLLPIGILFVEFWLYDWFRMWLNRFRSQNEDW